MRALDEVARLAAVALLEKQPRADYTIAQLPSGGVPIGSDLLPIYRNGQTYVVSISGIQAASGSYNVSTFGAVPDGTTINNGFFTSAMAAAGTGSLYIPPGNYRTTGAFNFTTPVQFAVGAMLLPDAGATVTFQRPIQAPLTQIFPTTGGTVNFLYGTTVYPEWWGAIPSLTVDSAPAINAALASLPSAVYACGTVQLQGNLYLIKSTIRHQKSGVSLCGMGRNSTVLQCGVVGMDAVYISAPGTIVPQLGGGGTNPPPGGGAANFVQWPRIEKMTLLQPAPSTSGATGGGYGLTLCYTAEALCEDLCLFGFFVGMSLQRAGNTNAVRIDANNTLSGANGFIGFKIDGSPQAGDNGPLGGNASTRFSYCTYSNSPGSALYGFVLACSNPTLKGTVGDIHFYNCETNFCNYGIYVDMSQVLTGVDGSANIFITNATLDTCLVAGIFLNGAIWQAPVGGVPVVSQHMNVSIVGGLFNSYPTTAVSHVAISNCRGISITGAQFFSPSTSPTGIVTGITIADSQDVVVTGNTFDSMDHWISMQKITNPSGYCTITANRFFGSADGTGAEGGHTPNAGIVATGTGNIIANNIFNGIYGNGIVTGLLLDANSVTNVVTGNVFNKASAAPAGGGTVVPIITNTIVNSGTGNVLANNIS